MNGIGISNIGSNAGSKNQQKKTTTVDGNLAVGFRDLLETKKSQEVGATDRTKDTLNISGYANVPQRLAELQKLHEETDYSGMTDMEIYKLINDRYEQAFPHRGAKMELNTPKYQDIGIQNMANLREAIKNPNFVQLRGEASYNRAKEYFGYQGLSNSEIIQKVKEEIPDDGSLENKIEIRDRLAGMGLISDITVMAFHSSIAHLQRQVFRETFGQEAAKDINAFENWLRSGSMEDVQMSWGEMKEFMFGTMKVAEIYGVEVQKELNDLFKELSEG
ncbi:hypothetical protein [Aminipila luticellarii]|uniref:Uncharacterized protein n=1 Tax=Aminipila luticellarii TaxID=2507160 RepID=A0A410PTA4_9FIRM|nr:hypothetical protein [Aminipila luticellarii]QAT42098.1 hypothetical protein EQM06_01995 [Aminipila luticellarii]